MSYSAGVFSINTAGQPVVANTTISASVFNGFTADIATGLSTCMLKDGTQTATAGIGFAAGTVSLPGIYLSTDTSTGLYRIAANNYGFAVTGSKVLDIASTGLAVTGTLSATGNVTFPIHFGSAAANGDLTLRATSNATATTSYIILGDAGTAAVGVGNTAPTNQFHAGAKVVNITTSPVGTGLFVSPTNNGGSSPAAVEGALVLGREGVAAQSYANYAIFKIGRYSSSGSDAHTQLDVAVSEGTDDSTGTTVLTLRGSGVVGIGTTAPAAKLAINGGLHVGGDTDPGDNNALIDGTLAVNGATLSTTSATFTALAGATTLLTIGGTGASAVVAIPGTLEQSTTTGALTVAGGVYIAKKLNVAGILTAADATDASSSTAGGTVVSGGLAVAKKAFIGTLLDLSTATAGQVKFPATQNASADANTLDDYEENTWTPVLAFGGASVDITYTTQVGTYTKIGRLVVATFFITLSSNGSSSGVATITGLPFNTAVSLYVGFQTNNVAYTGQGTTAQLVTGTPTTLTLMYEAAGGGQSALTEAHIGDTAQISTTFAYIV